MNSSNETFYSLDYWLSLYGYTYLSDFIFACIITPVWLLSLLLSIFSLFILLKAPFFASNFFSYMRLYVANCLILSVVGLTTILASTHRYFSITNTYEAVFYCNYIFVLAQSTLFLFSNCIEICLAVERSLYLLPRGFSKIKLISFKKFFFILFIICILVNLPLIFSFEPAFADIQLDQNNKNKIIIWHNVPTAFSFSLAGQIFFYLGYLFRDILPMILKIITNSTLVYLVGKYVKNKQRIRTDVVGSGLVNFDRKQTYIALVMNVFSLVEHTLHVYSLFLFFEANYFLGTLVIAFGIIFIAIKHLLIFFTLLVLNRLFRNEVRKCCKCVPVH